MKFIGWAIAGVSAVTATTVGVVKLGGSSTGSSLSTPVVAQTQQRSDTSQTHSSSSSTKKEPSREVKQIQDGWGKYNRCRSHSTEEKCKSLFPSGFRGSTF